MTQLENALDVELRSRRRGIMERKPPFFTFAVGMWLEDKPIYAIAFAEIPLLILALVLVGYLFVELEESWKERIRSVGGGEQGGMFRDERRHVRKGTKIVKELSNWMR